MCRRTKERYVQNALTINLPFTQYLHESNVFIHHTFSSNSPQILPFRYTPRAASRYLPSSPPDLYVFGLCVETRAPDGIPHSHKENVHTPRTQDLKSGFNMGLWCSEVKVLLAVGTTIKYLGYPCKLFPINSLGLDLHLFESWDVRLIQGSSVE